MSIIDKIWDYKRQYDEMDPYRRNQLQLAVIGGIVLVIALYVIFNSIESVRRMFNR